MLQIHAPEQLSAYATAQVMTGEANGDRAFVACHLLLGGWNGLADYHKYRQEVGWAARSVLKNIPPLTEKEFYQRAKMLLSAGIEGFIDPLDLEVLFSALQENGLDHSITMAYDVKGDTAWMSVTLPGQREERIYGLVPASREGLQDRLTAGTIFTQWRREDGEDVTALYDQLAVILQGSFMQNLQLILYE